MVVNSQSLLLLLLFLLHPEGWHEQQAGCLSLLRALAIPIVLFCSSHGLLMRGPLLICSTQEAVCRLLQGSRIKRCGCWAEMALWWFYLQELTVFFPWYSGFAFEKQKNPEEIPKMNKPFFSFSNRVPVARIFFFHRAEKKLLLKA